jgi:DNA-binding response OmpR family regulator
MAVDDDPKLLGAVTYALRQAGHIVFAAYNGRVALQQAGSVPNLDLLITNTRLGNMQAADLIRGVRAQRPSLPILHVGTPLPAGEFDDVPTLREPVSGDELLAAVNSLLGTRDSPQ